MYKRQGKLQRISHRAQLGHLRQHPVFVAGGLLQAVAEMCIRDSYMGAHGYSSLGLVIGGTHIEEAKESRAKYRDSCFLIPGYGAQGGTAEDIAQYLAQGNGGVVNSSPVSYTHLDVYKRQA